MAEIKFNTLYDQMSGANQDFYDDTFTKHYDPNKAWTDQKNVLTMKTLPNQSTPNFNAMRTAYDTGAQSKTLNKGFFNNLFSMGSADAAMPTDAERAAINNTGIMGASGPNMRDISGEVGEYGNTSGFDLSNMNLDDTSGAHMKLKGEPFFGNYQKFPEGDQWRNKDKYLNELNNTGTKKNFPGIIGLIQNMFQGAGDKLGMTQVSDADRAANQEFMQQTGIGINPQTGRMYGGNWNEASQDFAGKNAPGTSGWGSANFGEMAQAWDEKYGDMQYKTQKMKDKQTRIKKQAIEYAQKLEADRIEKERKKTITPTTVHHTGNGGGGDRPGGGWYSAPGTPGGEGTWKGYLGGRVGYNRGGRVGILAAF